MKFRIILIFFIFYTTNIVNSATDKNTLILINNYFSNLKTFKADFVQTVKNNDKNKVEGLIYLSRPGKLRFEYKEPFQSLLVNNNNVIYYYDIELDELTTLPSKKTPLNSLLKVNKDLKDLDFEIIEIKEENNKIYVITKNKNLKKVETENITFIFNKEIKILEGVIVEDDLNNTLFLTFSKIEQNITLPNELFIFNKNKLKK